MSAGLFTGLHLISTNSSTDHSGKGRHAAPNELRIELDDAIGSGDIMKIQNPISPAKFGCVGKERDFK